MPLSRGAGRIVPASFRRAASLAAPAAALGQAGPRQRCQAAPGV